MTMKIAGTVEELEVMIEAAAQARRAFVEFINTMAHKCGAMFNLPHLLANALLINPVIGYNATDMPIKQASFPHYTCPTARL
jgi:alcohol dehydrogenase class IV